MRLEPGLHESIVQEGMGRLDELERKTLGLSAESGESERAVLLSSILDDAQTLRLQCAADHSLTEVSETICSIEEFIEGVKSGRVPLNEKAGGLLLQAINVIRQAMLNLGTGTRAAALLPKALADLRRVMGGILSRGGGGRVSSRAASPQQPAASAKSEYLEMFLQDKCFGEFDGICRTLASAPASESEAKALYEEAFRLVHTIKGNAAMLGIESIASYAHVLEDLLQLVRSGEIRREQDTHGLVATASGVFSALLEQCKGGHFGRDVAAGYEAEVRRYIETKGAKISPLAPSEASSESSKKVFNPPKQKTVVARPVEQPRSDGFYLAVQMCRRRVLIPCESVADVLRKPHVMGVPGGQKGWLGVIRCRGGLVPLVNPAAILGASNEDHQPEGTWVVVLKGEVRENGENSIFSVPVEDVGQVVEMPFDAASVAEPTVEVTVLDLSKLNIWA